MSFTAISFADDANNLALFGVAQRGAGPFAVSRSTKPSSSQTPMALLPRWGSCKTRVARNILYRLDPATQNSLSPTTAGLGDRAGDQRSTGTGTDTREFGIFADIENAHYIRRANGFADTIIVRREAAGDVVGLAEVNNSLYAVTDAGELWRMATPNLTAAGRGAELIATNLPVGLTGMSRGPRNLTIDSAPSEFILDLNSRVNSGSFSLSVDGQPTALIPYNATAAQVRAALEALPGIGAGKYSCSWYRPPRISDGHLVYSRFGWFDKQYHLHISQSLDPPSQPSRGEYHFDRTQ